MSLPPALRAYRKPPAQTPDRQLADRPPLSAELLAFYQASNGLDLTNIDTQVLSFEAALDYAQALDYHPLSQAFGLWPLSESNDSNPYCVCLGPHFTGAVLRLSHDDTPRITHATLAGFLLALAMLVEQQADSIDACADEIPLPGDLAAEADALLAEHGDADEPVVLAILSACSPAALISALANDSLWVREEAAMLLGKHAHAPAREALRTLAAAGEQQDSRAAKKSLSLINKALAARR